MKLQFLIFLGLRYHKIRLGQLLCIRFDDYRLGAQS